MLRVQGTGVVQAYTVERATGPLHALSRRVKLCKIQHVRKQSVKPIANRGRRITCEVPAISSVSLPQTEPNSNGTGLAASEMEVAITGLQLLCRDALQSIGYDEEQSVTIAEVRMHRCRSQGLLKLCKPAPVLGRFCCTLSCETTATTWSKSSQAAWTSFQMRLHPR